MGEIKIQKEELRDQIANLREYLEDIADVEEKLQSAIDIFEDQKSPEVVGTLKDAMKEFKEDVNKLSVDKIEETINAIEVGVDSFEESDNGLKTEFEKQK